MNENAQMLCFQSFARRHEIGSKLRQHHLSGGGESFPPLNSIYPGGKSTMIHTRGYIFFFHLPQGENPVRMLPGRKGGGGGTFRTWHGTPLRRAVRVCSSMCTLFLCVEPVFSALGCSCVCCAAGEPALWGAAAVPNRRYTGPAFNRAGLALLRAPPVSRDFTGIKASTWHYSTGVKQVPRLYCDYIVTAVSCKCLSRVSTCSRWNMHTCLVGYARSGEGRGWRRQCWIAC